MNPFRYGGVVEKGEFCNRKQELHQVSVKVMTVGWMEGESGSGAW